MGSSASLDRSPRKNWVENAGGLPPYVREVARSISEKRGIDLDDAIGKALGVMKRWARGGGGVTAQTRAKATAAVAQWEATKARNRARHVAASNTGGVRTVELSGDGLARVMWTSNVTGRVVELARYVRTEAGARRYGRPVGTLIETGGKRNGSGSAAPRGGSGGAGNGNGLSGRARQRTDGQGKALPKGQRTGADYVREGLARRAAQEEKKRARYEAQRDGQLRARQRAVAKEWLAAKAAGAPATDRKQRERRAEVNAIAAEINRRGQQRQAEQPLAVGPNATGADRFARMGEMERRTALREASDQDLRAADKELQSRETGTGKPSGTRAAVRAEIERRTGGDRGPADVDGLSAREQRADTPATGPSLSKQRLTALENTTALSLRAARMKSLSDDDLRGVFDESRSGTQRSKLHGDLVGEMNRRGLPLAGHSPRTGDKPLTERSDRELDGMQRRARDAVRRGDGRAETGRDQATASAVSDERNRRREKPTAAEYREKAATLRQVADASQARRREIRAEERNDQRAAAAPDSGLASRLGKLTDGQLAAMDDALDRKGGDPSDRHKAIKTERARRGQSSTPQHGGGTGTAKRAPAAPSATPGSQDPARAAAPGTVASPAKPAAQPKGTPSETARPGPGKAATPKPGGSTTAAVDRPKSNPGDPGKPARRSAANATGSPPDESAPRGRWFDGRPRTLGDDEDDALAAEGRRRYAERMARGERMPDPYADDPDTQSRTPPVENGDAERRRRAAEFEARQPPGQRSAEIAARVAAEERSDRQATSRPAPAGSPRAPGRIPDARQTRQYNVPDRPMGREQPPAPPAAGGGPAGSPNLSRLDQFDDATLAAATARAAEREQAARQADPRRTSQSYRDAKLAASALRAEQNRRAAGQSAPAQAARPFSAARATVGDQVRLRGTQWRQPTDVEVTRERSDGFMVRTPDGREQFVETGDIEGPAAGGADVPAQRSGAPVPAGPQDAPPVPGLGRTGSGTRRMTGAQIRALQSQLMRETDPEKRARLRARIAAGRGMGGSVKQMSQPPHRGREVVLAMGAPQGKGRKLSDLPPEMLAKVEKRAAAAARGRSGPAAAKAAQAMVAARAARQKKNGGSSKSGPPPFVRGMAQAAREATELSHPAPVRPSARPHGAPDTASRAAQIVAGTRLGDPFATAPGEPRA